MSQSIFRDCKFAMQLQNTLPAFIRSVGHFRLTGPDRGSWRDNADYCELFWCLDGKGYFELAGERYLFRPGDIWYYPRGSQHRFYPAEDFLHYRWFTIQGEMAAALFAASGLKPGLSYGGDCPENLFAELELNIQYTTREQRMKLLATGFEILCCASAGGKGKPPKLDYLQEARLIMDNNFSDPDLNIQQLADILHINRVQLSREFSRHYGVTISEYLRNLRLQKSLELLQQKTMPLSAIAALCGYSSADYLGKVIRNATGEKAHQHRKRS